MQPLEQELQRCLQEADRYRLLAEQVHRHDFAPYTHARVDLHRC